MSKILFQFIVCLLPFLFSCPCFAVIADSNIITQIRQMKAEKKARLEKDYNNVFRAMREIRQAKIVPLKPLGGESDYMRMLTSSNMQKKNEFHNLKEKNVAIRARHVELADIKKQLCQLDANDLNVIIPSFLPPFHVSQFGRVGADPGGLRQELNIITIVSDTESIVNYMAGSRGRVTASHLDIIDKTIWLKGVNTIGLITGSRISPPAFLIITGTQDYQTPIGAKQTVFVFEPLIIP